MHTFPSNLDLRRKKKSTFGYTMKIIYSNHIRYLLLTRQGLTSLSVLHELFILSSEQPYEVRSATPIL